MLTHPSRKLYITLEDDPDYQKYQSLNNSIPPSITPFQLARQLDWTVWLREQVSTAQTTLFNDLLENPSTALSVSLTPIQVIEQLCLVPSRCRSMVSALHTLASSPLAEIDQAVVLSLDRVRLESFEGDLAKIASILFRFTALCQTDWSIACIYSHIAASQMHVCDIAATKTLVFGNYTLPKNGCRIIVLLSIGAVRVACFEASYSEETQSWSAALDDFSMMCCNLPYAFWGIELIVLQQSGVEQLSDVPSQFNITIFYTAMFAESRLRKALSFLSCPMDQLNAESPVRCNDGAIIGGSPWQLITEPPKTYLEQQRSFPKRSPSPVLNSMNLKEITQFSLSLPSRSPMECFLIDVGEDGEHYSELELAICSGDREAVESIIRRLENNHLLSN